MQCSVHEISLNLGLKHVTHCCMTLKCCVGWCRSLVCDILETQQDVSE